MHAWTKPTQTILSQFAALDFGWSIASVITKSYFLYVSLFNFFD